MRINKHLLKENRYLESGLGGHMAHPYEYTDLTFVGIGELIDDLFDARVERVTEKLDGQNIFVTKAENGEVRFARNNGDMMTGGFDRNFIFTKWASQEGVKSAYSRGYDIFTDALSGLRPEFFEMADARIWMNCEVISTDNVNVIPYQQNEVSVHGLVAYVKGTKEEVEIPDYEQKMAVLKDAVENSHSEHGRAQITPEIVLLAAKNAKEQAEEFKRQLNSIVMEAGEEAYPSMTIQDWKNMRQKNLMIEKGYGELFNLGEFSSVLERRLIGGEKQGECHSNNIKKYLMANMGGSAKEIFAKITEYEKVDQKMIVKNTLQPLEDFFVGLGSAVIENARGYENESRYGEVIKRLTDELEMKKIEIQRDFPNTAEYDKYVMQLRKFEKAGSKINALEGIVFNWRGMTMKLTGCFAPLNQIMGIGKYGR